VTRACVCFSAVLCYAWRAVMRCPSVRVSVCLSVTFVDSVETTKHIFKNFSPYQTSWQYSDGGVKCRLGRQKSRPMECEQQLRPSTVQFTAHTATLHWIFVYHNQRGRPQRSEENRFYLYAAVNLRSTYCTIEANYWQTRRIARPLCDGRTTCVLTCYTHVWFFCLSEKWARVSLCDLSIVSIRLIRSQPEVIASIHITQINTHSISPTINKRLSCRWDSSRYG